MLRAVTVIREAVVETPRRSSRSDRRTPVKLCSRLSQGSTQVKVRDGRDFTDAASRHTGESGPIKPRTVRSAVSAVRPRGTFHGDADPGSWAAKGADKRKT